MRRVCHLVDDTTPGGIMRLLDFVQTAPGMNAMAQHEIVETGAGFSAPPRLEADVMVSHVVLCWRNLPYFLALRARYPRKPIIHMEHHYTPAFVRAEVGNERRFNAMLSVSLSIFDRVVSICTEQRDWLVGRIGVDAGKVSLIPPCVDLARFLALDPVKGPIRRIGAIGRLHPQKGFDLLIPAFLDAAGDDSELHIFGDGEERGVLERLAANDSRIVFHGHVEDPVAAMGSVDAVAMPSRREPYGLVALETLAAGRPLLVSRVDGLRDHVAAGAKPVETFTRDAWSDAIAALLGGTDARKVAAARQRVAQAADRFAADWKTLFDAVS